MANAASDCDGILSLTRTLSYEQKGYFVARNIYSEYCEGTNIKSGSNFSLGLDTVIEELPIGLKIGNSSTEEKVKNVCSKYNNWYQSNANLVAISNQTPDRAIVAWETCQKLSKQDIRFSTQYQHQHVTFVVQRGTRVIDFLGMEYNPQNIRCTGPVGQNRREVTINTSTRYKLNEIDNIPISCVRLEKQNGTKPYFPATDVTIRADGGILTIPLPQEGIVGPAWSTEIENSLKTIRNDLSATGQRLDKTQNELLYSTSGADCTQSVLGDRRPSNGNWASIQCKAGSYLRGLEFTHPHGANGTHEESVRVTCCQLKK